MTTVCFFHTGSVLCDTFDDLAAEYIPDIDYHHQVDESVIDELLAVGELSPGITRRICTQLALAEDAGADVVLDTCSSTSPAVDVAREVVNIPIIKVDDPMAEQAVQLGEQITVLATARSTLEPSTGLVERKAEAAERVVTVDGVLVDEAFEARMGGDIERHDRLVAERARSAADEADVIILAQASMAHLEEDLSGDLSIPVLSSPELAMESLAEFVNE